MTIHDSFNDFFNDSFNDLFNDSLNDSFNDSFSDSFNDLFNESFRYCLSQASYCRSIRSPTFNMKDLLQSEFKSDNNNYEAVVLKLLLLFVSS